MVCIFTNSNSDFHMLPSLFSLKQKHPHDTPTPSPNSNAANSLPPPPSTDSATNITSSCKIWWCLSFGGFIDDSVVYVVCFLVLVMFFVVFWWCFRWCLTRSDRKGVLVFLLVFGILGSLDFVKIYLHLNVMVVSWFSVLDFFWGGLCMKSISDL